MRQLKVKLNSNLVVQAAHDICSPIAALKVLLAKADSLPIEQLKELLHQAAVRIEQVAEDLLESSRPSVHLTLRQWMEQKKMELDGAAELLLMADSNLQFDFEVSAGLSRVLSNLINNSIQADAKRVVLHVWTAGPEIAFAVNDDGHGFPNEVLEAMAEGRSVSGRRDGHGLGLSHAREFARRAGGHLQVMSSGTGSTLVLIRFPLP